MEKVQENSSFKTLDLVYDWVEFTIQNLEYTKVIEKLFHVNVDDCTYQDGGVNGYNQTWTLAHKIRIMKNNKNPVMGVHVLLSGFACREFEDLGYDWYSLFSSVLALGGKFSRIDVAIDMFKKYFSIRQLDKKLRAGEVTTKFRTVNYTQSYKVGHGDDNDLGETLTLGKRGSNIHIQFYDKLKEREQAGYKIDEKINWWLRCELRFRKDLADQVAKEFVDQYELSNFIFSVLKNYIDFKEVGTATRIERCKTWKNWQNFVGDVEKIQLAKKSVQSTIQKKDRYCIIQTAKSIAMLVTLFNEDYTKMLISLGLSKISDDDLSIINNYKLQIGEQALTRRDLNVLEQKYKGYDLLEFVKNH